MEIFQFIGRSVPPTNISARLVQSSYKRRMDMQARIIDYEKWIEPQAIDNYDRWKKEYEKHQERPIYLGIFLLRYRDQVFDMVEVWKTILHSLNQYGYFHYDDNAHQVIPVHLGTKKVWKTEKSGFIMCILPPSYKEDVSGILGL